MKNKKNFFLYGWLVHILTASGAVFCVLSLIFIHRHEWISALWALSACLIIDSVDGTLARYLKVKENIPQIDGALLDNLVDYVAYVIVPCFFIHLKGLVSEYWSPIIVTMIILSSSYQFAHSKAKTKDNFFRGFPCFWNLTMFYMLIVDGGQLFNLCIFLILIGLVFIPIKYLYISRMNNATNSKLTKNIIYLSTFIFSICNIHLLVFYPYSNTFCIIYLFTYIIAYFAFSIFRTLKPI